MFILSSDNASDFTPELIEKYDVHIEYLTFSIDGKEYVRDEAAKFTASDFYNAMRNGSPTSTSMINYETAKSYLSKLLEKGQDILHIAFDSALSGTYNSFKQAADDLNQTSANKIYVVDSKSAAGGEGLFLSLVAEKRLSGATIEETYEYANNEIQHIDHYFVVDDLKYLLRGGRVSKTAAFFGTILKIKPVLYVDEEGRLIPIQKVFGRKRSLVRLVEKMKEKYNHESTTVYISHGDCEDDANYVADKIKAEFGLEVKLLPLDFVIGAHSGPGTVALFFTSNDRNVGSK